MNQSLPERPSLEHLRGQAHRLLDEARAANPEALERFAVLNVSRKPKLADALRVISREYGYKSWKELRETVVQVRGALQTPASPPDTV